MSDLRPKKMKMNDIWITRVRVRNNYCANCHDSLLNYLKAKDLKLPWDSQDFMVPYEVSEFKCPHRYHSPHYGQPYLISFYETDEHFYMRMKDESQRDTETVVVSSKTKSV